MIPSLGNATDNSLPHLAHYYLWYERLMAHWRAVVRPPMVEISYEAIVAEPRTELARLLSHLGLEWDERCMDLESNSRPVLTASYQHVRRPPYRSAIDRWRPYRAHLQDLLGLETAVRNF